MPKDGHLLNSGSELLVKVHTMAQLESRGGLASLLLGSIVSIVLRHNSIHIGYVSNIPRHIWLCLMTTLGATRNVSADLLRVISSLYDKHADLICFLNSLHDDYNAIYVIIPTAILALLKLV